jgi:hypothetical protein
MQALRRSPPRAKPLDFHGEYPDHTAGGRLGQSPSDDDPQSGLLAPQTALTPSDCWRWPEIWPEGAVRLRIIWVLGYLSAEILIKSPISRGMNENIRGKPRLQRDR